MLHAAEPTMKPKLSRAIAVWRRRVKFSAKLPRFSKEPFDISSYRDVSLRQTVTSKIEFPVS
ncbi:hypothetical protein GHK46_15535 [Sinorhizobium medicae]|nr:hypothetical protein [Sinorhizobium medicae]